MAKHRKPEVPAPSPYSSKWPRQELERAKEIIKNKQGDTPEARTKLNQALFIFPDAKIAQELLDMNVVPSAQIMNESVYNLSPQQIENLILAGGPFTTEMLQDAVRLQRFEVAKVLLKYGAVPSDETLRQVETLKRRGESGKTLAAAFKDARKLHKTARREAFKSRLKHKLGLKI